MNLFEINSKIEELKDKDIDPEVLKDTLDSLELTRNDKLDGLAGWYDSNSSNIDWITDKIKTLQNEKKRLTNQNDRIMEYITQTIDDSGAKQIKTENHILRPRNYKATTVIEDSSLLPESYKHEETIEKIDKKLLYKDLKAGIEVNGAHLKPNRKTSIL
ncbi:hypothetical protein GCM10022297_01370 [Lactobacillus hamsteri]|uniref:Siphovirus Gp157 family protein n=1 Tax=Lactobacillus hamsteri DSM 5661 = JCM 6256 TaxID=1423754 RepID=A0A0R1Y4G2_9LACO|nr:siphovirus Gp157 family protein [Lactobacillus hamsteri]KRM37023.1 hypothetical protein FC39_GL000475 [Lactobacillus hamsteri DSM 5661 = JCM 6256]